MNIKSLLGTASLEALENIQELLPTEPRERLEETELFGKVFKFSPPTVITKSVDNSPVRTPQLPLHISLIQQLQNGKLVSLESILKAIEVEAGLSLIRSHALEQDGWWGVVYTSNGQPSGTFSVTEDGIFINEEDATKAAIDCDGDRAMLVTRVGKKKILPDKKTNATRAVFVKYPLTQALPVLTKHLKANDRLASINLETLHSMEEYSEHGETIWNAGKRESFFRKTHTPAAVGKITNDLLMYDLVHTAGLKWQEKVTNWPSLRNNRRMFEIEGKLKASRNNDIHHIERDDCNSAEMAEPPLFGIDTFISGPLSCITGIRGISSGKVGFSWIWNKNWKNTANRILTLDVQPHEVQPKTPNTRNTEEEEENTFECWDKGLIKRAMRAGILRFALIESQCQVGEEKIPAMVVWLNNTNNRPTSLVDTKRDQAGSSEAKESFQSYLAVLFPVFSSTQNRWMNPLEHMAEQFYQYINADGITYSPSGFKLDANFGNKFPASRKHLQELPFLAEDFRGAISYYVSKFGCFVNGELIKGGANQWTPSIDSHTIERIKRVVCVDYAQNFPDIEKMWEIAQKAYKLCPFAYYAYKPKDAAQKLYVLEKDGHPAWGAIGGNYKRYGAIRQILSASKAVTYKVALVYNKDSVQQMYLTKDGLAKTPQYRGNKQLLHTEDQYIHWCKCANIEPKESDRICFETMSGDLRYAWVVNEKASVKYPKFISVDGIKSFSAPSPWDKVTTEDGEVIDILLPAEEVVVKGLLPTWEKKGEIKRIKIGNKWVEALIVDRNLMRSCDPSENAKSTWKRTYARGPWEQGQMYAAMVKENPNWCIPEPDYTYIEELRRTRIWILTNYSRLVTELNRKAAQQNAAVTVEA